MQEICPLLHIDDLVGGLWIPGDGVGDPYQICLALIGEAKKKGILSCPCNQIVQIYLVV